MNLLQAVILGAVEGLTEFLPVSSTGHLILVARRLGLRGDAIDTYLVVIQAGALAAVVGLYWSVILSMWRGLLGRDEKGRKLLLNLLCSFVPIGLVGFFLHDLIKQKLFGVWPVVWALAVGGVVMVVIDIRLGKALRKSKRTLDSLTMKEALLIGIAQCLALWPGTSRSMVTIAAGMLLKFPATASAEYSFLLALPTLGAATLLDAALGGPGLIRSFGFPSVAAGFLSAMVVAALAVSGFIRYLASRGLAPFGWYRIGLALAIFFI